MSAAPSRCLYAYRPEQRPACQLAATLLYGTTALCSNCNQQRSTLGKGLVPRRLPVTEPDPSACSQTPTTNSRRPLTS